MNIKILKQINSIKNEIAYFEKKIEEIDKKPIKVVSDSVQGSSKYPPYTKHSVKIEGFESPKNKQKYKKMLKNAKFKLEKQINNLEYELNNINDSELRMMIRYKYIENMNYVQIAHKMNELGEKVYTDDSVRKKVERFLKKF